MSKKHSFVILLCSFCRNVQSNLEYEQKYLEKSKKHSFVVLFHSFGSEVQKVQSNLHHPQKYLYISKNIRIICSPALLFLQKSAESAEQPILVRVWDHYEKKTQNKCFKLIIMRFHKKINNRSRMEFDLALPWTCMD